MRCLHTKFGPIVLFSCIAISPQSFADEQRGTTVYFPTKVGTKWTYDSDGKEQIETVTAVEKKDGATIVTVELKDEFGRKSQFKMRASEQGLFQLTGVGFATKHPPSCLLKLPHEAGQRWEAYTGARGSGFGTLTAFGPEKIKVPAGEFEAIRVETTFPQFDKDDTVAKYWYAPKVGLVKYEFDKQVRVLKSFRAAK